MDKGKKGGKGGKIKSITLNKTPLATKLGGKNLYIVSRYCGRYTDTNNAGNVFFNEESSERDKYQKWNLIATETPGVYSIRGINTDMYLTSNERGDINTRFLDNETNYQKWSIMTCSEAECYVITNYGNNYILSCNKMDQILMNNLEDSYFEDCPTNILFRMFQYKPKK
jgi:hypothetical protein